MWLWQVLCEWGRGFRTPGATKNGTHSSLTLIDLRALSRLTHFGFPVLLSLCFPVAGPTVQVWILSLCVGKNTAFPPWGFSVLRKMCHFVNSFVTAVVGNQSNGQKISRDEYVKLEISKSTASYSYFVIVLVLLGDQENNPRNDRIFNLIINNTF